MNKIENRNIMLVIVRLAVKWLVGYEIQLICCLSVLCHLVSYISLQSLD